MSRAPSANGGCLRLGEDVDLGLLGRGLVLGFAIAAAIAPVSLLVIQRTIAHGRRIGLVSGLGVATADATYGTIAAFGLTALTGVLVGERRAIGLVGGVFLLWLAWRTGRARPVPATEGQPLQLGPRNASEIVEHGVQSSNCQYPKLGTARATPGVSPWRCQVWVALAADQSIGDPGLSRTELDAVSRGTELVRLNLASATTSSAARPRAPRRCSLSPTGWAA